MHACPAIGSEQNWTQPMDDQKKINYLIHVQKYLDSNPKHFGPVLNDLGSMKDGGINFRRYYPKLVKLSFQVSKYQNKIGK